MPLYSIDTHGELYPFLSHEWLLTNGAGAFAMSSLVGCNTRRYHGLLCAATLPPVGRIMALNRIGELVFLDGRSDFLELSINQFGQSFHPRGDKYLRNVQLGRTARWTYDVEGVTIVKELQIVWQKNAIGLRYQIESKDREVELHLLPFVSLRDFHSLRHAAGTQFDVTTDVCDMSVSDKTHTLRIHSDGGKFSPKSDWWFGHFYAVENERGLDDSEDLYVPGLLAFKTKGPATLTMWASVNGESNYNWDEELNRRPEHVARRVISVESEAPAEEFAPSAAIQRLSRAAADFVVTRRRPDGKPGSTIIAGYPWFADWGRDTMISLPGLLLTTQRFEEAAAVLSVFAEYVSEGMIPNKFDDYTNEPSYNTVDASLWFIHACFEFLRISGDRATFDARLLPACRHIVKGHIRGTRFNIGMDETDGLITAGDANTQLTWMDAKCGGIAFTPRHGKAVEINALWYNALMLVGNEELAAKVRANFVKTFWQNPFRGLYDVVSGNHRDGSIRPNQIFAVSLPHSPLDENQRLAVTEVVRRELLTPYGLRTLNRGDASYRGRYSGNQMKRDEAYHNGTVWPWLIGPFLEAYLRVNGRSVNAQRQARVWLQPLVDHMNQGCVGQVSECFEADEPHRPVGCPAQAWSVAEVLRLAVELRM